MRWYIVLMNGHEIVDILSYDNEDAWEKCKHKLGNVILMHRSPYYDSVLTHYTL